MLPWYFVLDSTSSVDNATAVSKSKQARSKRRRNNKARGGVAGGSAKSLDASGTNVGVVGNTASVISGSSEKTKSEAGDGPQTNRISAEPIITAKKQLPSPEGTPAGDKNSDQERAATNEIADFDKTKEFSQWLLIGVSGKWIIVACSRQTIGSAATSQ